LGHHFLKTEIIMQLKSLLFSFNGRINRLPYWVVNLVLMGWGSLFHQLTGPYGPDSPIMMSTALLATINFTFVVWIWLAVQVKRFHDRNKSGWWALINLIPIIGQLWVLIECGFLQGTAEGNRFGGASTSASKET